MSEETLEWLNTNTLIGFTDKRGNFWHYKLELQGDESNHYTGAIPVEDVKRRLFNWQAVSSPVIGRYVDPEGNEQEVKDATRQLVIRNDTGAVLGSFMEGYAIHAFDEWLVNDVSRMLDSDLAIGSAGLLKGGAIAWVQIEMPDSIVTPEGETIRPFVTAFTSHSGKFSSTYKRGITRVGCDNTLEGAINEGGATYKEKHSKYSRFDANKARETLDILHSDGDEYMKFIAECCQTEVSGKQYTDFLSEFVPIPEEDGRAKTMATTKRDEYVSLYLNDGRVAPYAGTKWGVLQMVNTHTQHFGTLHKGTKRGEKNIFNFASDKLFDADRKAMATLDKILVNV